MRVLEAKVAIVTGAARGVGAGIAAAMAAEGARVAVLDVRERQAAEVADRIVADGGTAAPFVCDVTDSVGVQATVEAVVDRWGTVDILVNNAQSASFGVAFEHITDEHMDQAFASGPRASVAFMRACFPYLKGGGRVINLRSGSEIQGLAGFGSYIAAKGAIGALTRAAAREWGAHGITVNALCPYVLSDSAQAFFTEDPAEEARLLERMAIPRYGDAQADVGATAVFLASEAAAYITGCTINVNGGVTFLA
jgi:NAD(P)-dependent dehydrogenase (short-subunit alcohol dehydrogenase family)